MPCQYHTLGRRIASEPGTHMQIAAFATPVPDMGTLQTQIQETAFLGGSCTRREEPRRGKVAEALFFCTSMPYQLSVPAY
eukprot:236719-Rhodomonas_salina.1